MGTVSHTPWGVKTDKGHESAQPRLGPSSPDPTGYLTLGSYPVATRKSGPGSLHYLDDT